MCLASRHGAAASCAISEGERISQVSQTCPPDPNFLCEMSMPDTASCCLNMQNPPPRAFRPIRGEFDKTVFFWYRYFMDGETLKKKAIADEWSITTHAFTEARKDGIDPYDIERILKNGEILEDYPGRRRCFIGGTTESKMPLHVVCDYYDFLKDRRQDVVVVTAYIPDTRKWLKDKKRKERE